MGTGHFEHEESRFASLKPHAAEFPLDLAAGVRLVLLCCMALRLASLPACLHLRLLQGAHFMAHQGMSGYGPFNKALSGHRYSADCKSIKPHSVFDLP